MRGFGTCSFVHVLRKEKQTHHSRGSRLKSSKIWFHILQKNISILPGFDSTYNKNTWNCLDIQISEIWFHAQIIHPLQRYSNNIKQNQTTFRGGEGDQVHLFLHHLWTTFDTDSISLGGGRGCWWTWNIHIRRPLAFFEGEATRMA